MVRHIVGALIVVLIAIVGGIFLLPSHVHVERSVVIARPAADIYPYINSLRRAQEWSPWAEIDPAAKVTFSGYEQGVGAKMSWSGNAKVGAGTQEITQTVLNRKVASDLHFDGRGAAKAAVTLTTTDKGTNVVWTLDVDLGSNLIARVAGLSIDKQVGADYERGLAKLKTLIEHLPEGGAQPASAPTTAPNAPTS